MTFESDIRQILITEDLLTEESTLTPDESGLDVPLFFSSRGNAKHNGARVKFPSSGNKLNDTFTITTDGKTIGNHSRKAHEINKYKDWIKNNRSIIEDHWRGIIDKDKFKLNVKDADGFYTNKNHPDYISPEKRAVK